MSILSDHDIRSLCVGLPAGVLPMLDPFSEGVQGGGVISYGLTHAGYDLRLGYKVLVFKNTHCEPVDPKAFVSESYRRKLFDEISPAHGEMVWIPAHGYVLGYSLEYIRMPKMLKGRCVGKSTLARSGVLVNTTPLEPGWTGHLTIEIANVSPCQVCLYAGEGVAQLEFDTLSSQPDRDYAAKDGKYQNQKSEPVPAKVIL